MKPIFLTVIAICCLLTAQAQNKNTLRNDSLVNREMTLEKEYNATIRDALKISQLPASREPQTTPSAVEFSNYASPFSLQPKSTLLDPKTYLAKANYSKYKGYLTGGISSLIDIDGDFGYQILNTDKDRLNIFLSHRSSGCNVSYLQDVSNLQETGKQKFKINDNWGGLNFLHNFGGVKFSAEAKYTYSAFNYYGLSIPYIIEYIMPGPEPNNHFDKNTNQINQMLEAYMGLFSEEEDMLNYKINLGYTNFRQRYGNTKAENGSNESRFLADGTFYDKITANMGIGIDGSINTYSYGNSLFKTLNDSTTNYWFYSLNPYLFYENNSLNLILGVKMNAEIKGRGKVIWSPVISFNYYFDKYFTFYLNADGGRNDNSQYNMYYENRYVDPLIRVMDSRSPLDATAGIKIMPLSSFSLDIFGGYKITKDEHFFYSNVGAKNHFEGDAPMLAGCWISPIYEDANTLKLGADLKYAYQNLFELNLKGTYYQWTIVKKEPEDAFLHQAWNKPNFEVNLNAGYRIPWFPLRFDLSYYGAFGRKSPNSNIPLEIYKMNDIHDLSLKGTYSITPNFSLYASLNNLLFSKYDLWWGYPAQGFNIMGGLSFLF